MPAPTRPSQTSGPGAYARRTDGGPAQKLSQLSNANYGEQATYQQAQRGAPMAQTPGPSRGPSPSQYPSSPGANAVVPFSAPTQRPWEPVTSGAASGPGPGPESLGISPQQVGQADVSKISQYIPVLEFVANLPGASPGARLYVNYLKANQSASASQSPSPIAGQPALQGAVGAQPTVAGQGTGPNVRPGA